MRLADPKEFLAKLAGKDHLFSASLEVTRRCNLDCIHCLRVHSDEDGLSYSEICDLIDQLAEMDCIELSLTGGEPFARRDFMDIVRYARDKDLAVRILTNGTLVTSDIADQLKSLHILSIRVSLYGASPAIHDAVTTVRGSFEKTIETIKLLRERDIHTRAMMVVMSCNAGEFQQVRGLCGELDTVFQWGVAVFPREDGSLAPLRFMASDEQLRLLKQKLLPEKLAAFAEIEAHPEGGPLCSAGISRIGIGTDGAVYSCSALRLSVGSICEQKLSEIWRSAPLLKQLRSVKRTLPSECATCHVRERCFWCPGLSLALEGDMRVPNSQDCRRTRFFINSEGGTNGCEIS